MVMTHPVANHNVKGASPSSSSTSTTKSAQHHDTSVPESHQHDSSSPNILPEKRRRLHGNQTSRSSSPSHHDERETSDSGDGLISGTSLSSTGSASDSLTSPLGDFFMFENYYSDQYGPAHRFEIFDADDASLWTEPLPCHQLLVFPTAELAQKALEASPTQLAAIPEEYLAPQVEVMDADRPANSIEFSIWY
jgi:hypothetical protein